MNDHKVTLSLGSRIVEKKPYRSQLEVCVNIGYHNIIRDGKSPTYQHYTNVYDSLVLRNLQHIGREKEVEKFLREVAGQYGKIVAWEICFKNINQWDIDCSPCFTEEEYPFSPLSKEAMDTFESSLNRNYLYAKLNHYIRRSLSVGI